VDITILTFLHILSAIVLFGTGLGTAFHGFVNNLSRDVRTIAVANRTVVLADWIFTAPAVILQPVTGLLLALRHGWPLSTGWLLWAVGLYALAGACWLPVVYLQIRMCRMAEAAVAEGTDLPPAYHRMFRLWFALGWPAFAAVLVILWLMVAKPDL
jgi:uncharacterized membrane protein